MTSMLIKQCLGFTAHLHNAHILKSAFKEHPELDLAHIFDTNTAGSHQLMCSAQPKVLCTENESNTKISLVKFLLSSLYIFYLKDVWLLTHFKTIVFNFGSIFQSCWFGFV